MHTFCDDVRLHPFQASDANPRPTNEYIFKPHSLWSETDKGQEGSWFHSLLCDLSPQEPASRAVHPSKTDIE